MNISSITSQLLCSGCGTCNAVCGQRAISMKRSPTMGLLYADVCTEKCTDCGLCLKMCPSNKVLAEKDNITTDEIIGSVKECYVGRTNNEIIYNNAQSGGVATGILSYLFETGKIDAAICCRMEYGSPLPSVHFQIITTLDELTKCQKSCYTQVDMVSALSQIGDYNSIAVVGVPCQISGISNLMRLKRFGKIKYKIGLICDKSFSDTYMDALICGEKKIEDDIVIEYKKKNFLFEGQYYSYQEAPTVVKGGSGQLTIVPRDKRIFLKDFFTVPKCKLCWDKLNICADLVLGDPWGIENRYDKNAGDSVILVRTDKANCILQEMLSQQLVSLTPVPLNDVVRGQLIKERVSMIHNLNWIKLTQSWKKKENHKKKALLKSVFVRYKLHRSKNILFTILSRIKHLFLK